MRQQAGHQEEGQARGRRKAQAAARQLPGVHSQGVCRGGMRGGIGQSSNCQGEQRARDSSRYSHLPAPLPVPCHQLLLPCATAQLQHLQGMGA